MAEKIDRERFKGQVVLIDLKVKPSAIVGNFGGCDRAFDVAEEIAGRKKLFPLYVPTAEELSMG